MLKWIEFEPDVSLAEGLAAPSGISFDAPYDHEKRIAGEGVARISTLVDQQAFAANNYLYVEQHRIKAPGTMLHRIPENYQQFGEFLRLVAAFEAAHSDYLLHREGVLTIRQTNLYTGSTQTRLEDWHRDSRDNRNGPLADSIYVACTHAPTLFQKGGLTDAFRQVKDPANTEQAEPFTVYLMNSYCWHKPVATDRDGVRTFARMVYRGPEKDYAAQHFTPAQHRALQL